MDDEQVVQHDEAAVQHVEEALQIPVDVTMSDNEQTLDEPDVAGNSNEDTIPAAHSEDQPSGQTALVISNDVSSITHIEGHTSIDQGLATVINENALTDLAAGHIAVQGQSTLVNRNDNIPAGQIEPHISPDNVLARECASSRVFHCLDTLEFMLDYADKASLLRIARSSKFASVPALKRIWKKLDSLKPLLALLPERILPEELAALFPRTTYIRDGNIRKGDMLRWNAYSGLVRYIRLGGTTWYGVLPKPRRGQSAVDINEIVSTLLLHIVTWLPTPSLLPNLVRIEVVQYQDALGHTIRACLGPNITSLIFQSTHISSYPGSSFISLLESLEDSAPRLQELEFPPCSAIPPVQALQKELVNLPKLETLRMGKLLRNQELLKVMASLNGLRTLQTEDIFRSKTWKNDDEVPESTPFCRVHEVCEALTPESFSHLENLTLDTTMEFCISLFKSCKPPLSSFTLKCMFSTAEDIEELLLSICQLHKGRRGRSRINHLSITMDGVVEKKCFTAFRRAKKLRLHSLELCLTAPQPSMYLTDDVLPQLISECNSLRKLKLHFPSPRRWWGTTPRALITVLVHCPNLQEVQFHRLFQRSSPTLLESPLVSEFPHMELKGITLVKNHMKPLALAKLLACVAPNSRLKSDEGAKEVNNFLDALEEIRDATEGAGRFFIP